MANEVVKPDDDPPSSEAKARAIAYTVETLPQQADRDSDPPNLRPCFWLWILCLLGVDYFSTLSYQPSLTYHIAGPLGPLATILVVGVTLFAVLPLYLYLAKHSPHGEGSVAVVERLVGGWRGKTLILILLGFAAADFVMLKSISLSDAAEHLRHNQFVASGKPFFALATTIREAAEQHLGDWIAGFITDQVVVSLLLGGISFFFWFLMRDGFNQRVVKLSVILVACYLLLAGAVIVSGLVYLLHYPDLIQDWQQQVAERLGAGGQESCLSASWPALLLACVLLLPHLSLGFSGFELSMILMPQVRGRANDDPNHPGGRIRNTRKMLVVAALVMCLYLLGSVLVTTVLIPAEEIDKGGSAAYRSLAYLAHGGAITSGVTADEMNPLFGGAFGSIFDLVTILVLCFAGTSVMTALAFLLPRILLRFGMELQWASRWGLLFLWFAIINLAVTVGFQADVNQQKGAYAVGVLALILCTAAAALGHWRRHRFLSRRFLRFPWRFAATVLLFGAMFIVLIVTAPSGLLIACCFVGVILASSVISRAVRTHEMRTIGFEFVDVQSRFLWDSLRDSGFPVLVPHRPGRHASIEKEAVIRRDHQLDPGTEIVFLEVEVDDPSNFYQQLLVEVKEVDDNYVIKITQCVSVAHAIAAVALEMTKHANTPPGVHFGWSEVDLLAASWSYLAFGEGNVPWKVRELLLEAEPDPARRPRLVIG